MHWAAIFHAAVGARNSVHEAGRVSPTSAITVRASSKARATRAGPDGSSARSHRRRKSTGDIVDFDQPELKNYTLRFGVTGSNGSTPVTVNRVIDWVNTPIY